MLTAGFVGKEEAFAQLKQCHALERIATPDEIADTACFLLSGNARFFSGSTLFLDGGVLSRLHDPASSMATATGSPRIQPIGSSQAILGDGPHWSRRGDFL